MRDHDEHEAIFNDKAYWLDQTCDVLEIVDLSQCTVEQLAPLALYLRTLARTACSSPCSGDSTVRHLKIVR